MKNCLSTLLVAGLTVAASAQIALDNAENAVYVVGQEFIQVGTTPGDQTAATNGLNGGFGFERWQRGGYGDNGNFGNTKISNVSSSFNMGTKQFALRSGVDGLNFSGCDARRRLLQNVAIGSTVSFSLMPGGNGAGVESTSGDFGVEFRGASLSNPGRDLFAMNASFGQNYSLQDESGSQFTNVPVVGGQRVDVTVVVLSTTQYTVTIQPFGGLPDTRTLTSYLSSAGAPLRTVQFYAYQTNGDSYVNFLRVQGPGVPISGRITLQNYLPSPAGQVVAFQVKDSGGNVLETHNATLNAQGDYSFTASSQGNLRVTAKASHWLRKSSAILSVGSGGASNVNLSLPNADSLPDNIIDIGDYTILANAFTALPSSSNWDARADLNGDEIIDIADYVILSGNFSMVGDN